MERDRYKPNPRHDDKKRFQPFMTTATRKLYSPDKKPRPSGSSRHGPRSTEDYVKYEPRKVREERHVYFSQASQPHAKPRRSPKVGLDDFEMNYQQRLRRPSFSGSAELGDVDQYLNKWEMKSKASILKPPREQARKSPRILEVLLGGRKQPDPKSTWGEWPRKSGYTPYRSHPIKSPVKEAYQDIQRENERGTRERAEARAWMESSCGDR